MKLSDYAFNNIFVCTLIFLTFFKPLSCYYFPVINKIYNIMMFTSIILISVCYIFFLIDKHKISKIQISIICFSLVLLLSTAINSKDFGAWAKTYTKWMAISFYTEMLIFYNKEILLKSISYIMYSYIIINFIISIIIPNGIANPDGLTPVYFLGNDNTTTLMMTLGVMFIWFKDIYFHDKIDKMSIIPIVLLLMQYIKDWSVTSIMGTFMVVIYLVAIYKRNKKQKVLNYNFYMLAGIIIFIMVIVFRVQNNFQEIFENILHKSITFTGRTQIWDRCFNQLNNNWLLGLGVEEFEKRLIKIEIFHAHCTYLNVMLEGGIIGFITYCMIFGIIGYKLKNVKNCELKNLVSYVFFIFSIVGLVEVYQDSQMLYIFIVISYYLDKIIESKKIKE